MALTSELSYECWEESKPMSSETPGRALNH